MRITAEPGTYALILESAESNRIGIGRLGTLSLTVGYYIYVGSAFGPGGLAARIAHHRRLSRRPHWHIDYLRHSARIAKAWFTYDNVRREHQWADLIGEMAGVNIALPGFGASDCGCTSHLFFCPRVPSKVSFMTALQRLHPGHGKVYASDLSSSLTSSTV